jgi:predicted transposase/invertase (TIGR01784 family)
MQVSPQEGFEKRAQYYAAKAYSRQLNKGEEEGGRYKDLKEVIFIAICERIIFKDKLEYKSDHIILDKNTHEHNLKDFSFTFLELPKFKINKIEDLNTIVEKWCYFFKYAETTHEEDVDKIISSDKVIEKAYNELNRFYWTEAELNSYDKEIKRIMDNLAADDYLSNVSRNEGREEGRSEGEKIKAFEIAKNLLSMNLDIDVIVKATGLTREEITSLKSQK